jgi:hypothetical protein
MSELSFKDKLSSLLILRRQTIARLNLKNPCSETKGFSILTLDFTAAFHRKARHRNDSSLIVSVL